MDAKFGGRTTRCPEPNCHGKLRIPEPKPATSGDGEINSDLPDPVAAKRSSKKAVSQSRTAAEEVPANRDSELDYDLDARGVALKSKPQRDEPARAANEKKPRRESRRDARRRSVADSTNQKRDGQKSRWLAGLKSWQVAVGLGGVVVAVLCVVLAPNGAATPATGRDTMAATEKPPEKPKADLFKTKLQPFVQTYCKDCHGSDDPQAGINLLSFIDEGTMLDGGQRKTWETVLSMIEIGAMPPPDVEQPKKVEREEVIAYLEDKLYNLDCDLIDDPGRVTVRRLNRTEYNNTVRDLLGVTFKPADDFPSDDVGYGFDNIGDVLSLSPLLMEKYLDAAEKITAQAIPVTNGTVGSREVTAEGMRHNARYDNDDGLIGLFSAGEVTFDYTAPVDGEYTFSIEAKADQFGNELAKMDFRIDGQNQRTFDVSGRREAKSYEHKLKLKPGKHQVDLAFINDAYVANKGDRNLYVGTVTISAPPIPSKSDGFVSVRPKGNKNVKQAATEVLTPFVTKAFRRPATAAEIARYVGIVELAAKDGESFDQSIQYAVQGVFISPSFLFRVETDQRPNDPMASRVVSDYELASRLSYFIWSTMPDEKLFELAGSGQLGQPVVLEQQVKRMLADSKAQALTNNFAEQWLNLRSLDEITPDPALFKGFSTELKDDMKRETLLLFDTIKSEDRSILEFLDADFTFVNQRLAQHYGMPPVNGAEFQRVSLNPKQRAGVLTHASVLTITSNPDRTSPVKRGKWIMENVLGSAPPPPPPNVPELEATQKAKPNATLREQLELHRKDPGCASCHRTMDTLGFGFENFNAVGIWRDKDGGHDINPSGVLPSGDKFDGPTELVQILKARKKQFSRCLSEKMLTYALGRGLEYYDRCAIDEILDRLDRNNYRFSQLVSGIVNSRPFLNRRGDGERE